MIIPVLVIIEQFLIGPSTIYVRTLGPNPPLPPKIAPPNANVTASTMAIDRSVDLLGPPPSVWDDESANFSSFSRLNYAIEHYTDERLAEKLVEKDPLTCKLFGLSARQQIISSYFLCVFGCILSFIFWSSSDYYDLGAT